MTCLTEFTPGEAVDALRRLPGVVDCVQDDQGLLVQVADETLERSLPELLRDEIAGLEVRLIVAASSPEPATPRLAPGEFLL